MNKLELRDAIEKKFTDQFFASTEGRNDIRREQIKLFTDSYVEGLIPDKPDDFPQDTDWNERQQKIYRIGFYAAIDQLRSKLKDGK